MRLAMRFAMGWVFAHPITNAVLSSGYVRLLVLLGIGALAGWLGWHDRGQFGAVLLFLLASLVVLPRASQVFVLFFGYYALLGSDVVPAAAVFHGWSLWLSIALFVAQAALYAAAFAAAHLLVYNRWTMGRQRLHQVIERDVGVVLLALVFSTAALSWGNPFLFSGQFLPGWGLLSILALALLASAVGYVLRLHLVQRVPLSTARYFVYLGAALMLLAFLPMLADRDAGREGVGWHGVHTEFDQARTVPELLKHSRHLERVVNEALAEDAMRGSIIVFPEGMVGKHRDSLDAVFAARSLRLRAQDMGFLLQADARHAGSEHFYRSLWFYEHSGVELIYRARHLPPGSGLNVLPARGKPLQSPLVRLRDDVSVVVAICYEAMLLEHWMRAMVAGGSSAQRVVYMSNLWFLDGSVQERVSQRMRLSAQRGASLMGLHLVEAHNR